MKLSCPSCSAKYSIADEKVQDRLAKIRCRKCSATIIVDGKVSPPSVYTSDAGGAGADTTDASGGPMGGEYSIDFGDNDQRTMTIDDIVQAYSRGELTADTFAWAEGFADWTAIRDVPELADAIASASAPAAARAAARTGAGRGSAHDLFGGIETAGSEEDVMTSAPQAQPQASAGAATGARNESSVLFSLSALTASAPAAAPTKGSAPSAVSNGKDDDSGLIDLKALTSAVSAQAPSSPLVLGTAPLGMAAPLGGMTAPAIATDSPAHKPASSKTGIYIAAAMVVVGVLIAGAIVFKGNQEPAQATAAVAPPAEAPAAPTPPPAPEAKKEEPTAAPPATGTAEEPAKEAAPTKPTSAPKAAVHYTAPKKSTASAAPPAEKPAAKSSDTSDTPPPKKKPKEKSCNCSPGDLMCAMKCAAS